MAIQFQDIEHLANLAKLGLSEEEKRALSKDLAHILDYVGELSKADTADLEPMTGGTELENRFREDEERTDSFKDKDALLEEAPAKDGRHFKVPRILE